MLGYLQGREARPTSLLWIIIKTWLQTIVFWSLFLLILPLMIYGVEEYIGLSFWRFPTQFWQGLVLFALGGTLGVTSSLYMAMHGLGTPLPADCPRQLVITGPYRFIRNPMAVAGLTQAFAVGVMLGSPAVLLYSGIGGPIWHVLVRPWEEADLLRRFGEPYQNYRSQVQCWWPNWRGYRASAETASSNHSSSI